MTTSLSAAGVNSVYGRLVGHCMHAGALVPSRNGQTRELHPAVVEVNDPRRRLVTAWGRPVNVAFALAEVLWIMGGRRDVEMLAFYNSKIVDYSDDGKTFNAAYGYRLRHEFGYDQIEDVVRTLKADPDSRQAVLNVWSPVRDRGYTALGPAHMSAEALEAGADFEVVANHTKDRACNVMAHPLIREGKLDWLQIVRSNDALWGVPYNWMQWMHLQEQVAVMVGVPVGKYVHVADSLHIYDYHWEEALRIRDFDLYEEFDWQHELAAPLHPGRLSEVLDVERSIRLSLAFRAPVEVGSYWRSVLHCLTAFAFWKLGNDSSCYSWLSSVEDRVLAAASVRFYWDKRWRKQRNGADSKIAELIDDDYPPRVAAWIKGEWQHAEEG